MLNFRKIIILLIIFPLLTFAQRNYKDAILTDLSGVKRNILLDVKNWDINPSSIPYLSAGYASQGTANPSNTASIAIGDVRFFERAIVKKSMNRIVYPDLPKFLDSTSVIDTVFLDLVTTGRNVSLYRYTDQLKTRFFIKLSDGHYQELMYRMFYSAAIDFGVETQNIFRDQLKGLMGQPSASNQLLSEKIAKAKYQLKDLKEISILLNSNEVQFTQVTKSKRSFSIGLGLNLSKFVYKGANVLGTSLASKPVTMVPVFGLSYSLDERNKSSFNAELAFSKEKVEFRGIDNHSEETKRFTQYTYSISPSYRYNLFDRFKTKIFIGIGVRGDIHQYKDDVVTYLSTEIPGAKVVEYRDAGGFQGLSLAIPGSIGVKAKQLTFVLTYVPYLNSMTNFAESEVVKSSYNFALHYNLSRL